jgi:tetratricopeptide (TPR) repeat protein
VIYSILNKVAWMKKLLTSAMLLLLVGLPLLGQEILIGYVDGVLEVRDGSRWSELYIGDAVSPSDRIRLGRESYAELTSGRTTVKLSRAGTYAVSNLIEGTGRTESTGIAGMVLNRISRLTGRGEDETKTSAGGARASEAVNQSAPTWAGGESIPELIAEGKQLLSDGAYEDAYYVFQEAYDYAITDEEYARSLFYYGYASTLVGKSAQAFDLLQEIGPDEDTEYFASHVLALGQLLIESFAYNDAVNYLSELEQANGQDPADVQSAQLLIGVAYDGMGNAEQARTYFRRASETIRDNEVARTAERLLGEL